VCDASRGIPAERDRLEHMEAWLHDTLATDLFVACYRAIAAEWVRRAEPATAGSPSGSATSG